MWLCYTVSFASAQLDFTVCDDGEIGGPGVRISVNRISSVSQKLEILKLGAGRSSSADISCIKWLFRDFEPGIPYYLQELLRTSVPRNQEKVLRLYV